MATSWDEKYEEARPSVVRTQEKAFADLQPGQMVVIPGPQDVDRAVGEIPPGEVRSQRQLRQTVAGYHQADNACPAVTGIQLRVVAELATEALDAGAPPDAVTPFWRVVEPGSKIASRLPGGSDRIAALRERETRVSG
jgi:hypothetical protein